MTQTTLPVLAAGALLAALAGCDKSAGFPETHPVRGSVKLAGGDVRQLAGGHVEAALVGDLRVTATGEIREDGRFILETFRDGKAVPDLRAGDYQARIVLTDEDAGAKKRRGAALPPRYDQYPTSGLTFRVPAPPDGVVLMVAAK